jgi:hypothetical protein
VGAVSLGFGPDGRRRRRKVYGTTKTAVYDKLRELHRELNKGVAPKADYTVGDCLDHGRNRVSGSTRDTERHQAENLCRTLGRRCPGPT